MTAYAPNFDSGLPDPGDDTLSVMCPDCGGSGDDRYGDQCDPCRGSGEVRVPESDVCVECCCAVGTWTDANGERRCDAVWCRPLRLAQMEVE